MNLAIDIGNSSVKIVVFQADTILYTTIWEELTITLLHQIFEQYPIKKSILSSVAHHSEAVEELLEQHTFFIKLATETPLPIQNLYKTPETLGKDRIASVIGGQHLYPRENLLCIDAGTCITYDFLRKDGAYLGGSISPGLMMRFNAMHHFTARLPLLDKQRLENIIGYNTETAMQTGAQFGLAFEIEGFIKKYRQEFGQLKVIITGGDADYFATLLESKIFAHSNLVLIGLNKILNYNAKLLE